MSLIDEQYSLSFQIPNTSLHVFELNLKVNFTKIRQ